MFSSVNLEFSLHTTTGIMLGPGLSFRDYLKGDTHSAWAAAAPAHDVTSIRATIRRDFDQLEEGRTPWPQQFAATVQHTGNPEDLSVAATYICALEGVCLG